MKRSSPQNRALSTFIPLLVTIGCSAYLPGCQREGPRHASEISPNETPPFQTPSTTATERALQVEDINQTSWLGDLIAEGEQIQADTTVQMWFEQASDDRFTGFIRHLEGGTLIVGDNIIIPSDDWLQMEGHFVDTTNPPRLYLTVDDFGHKLEFDGDLYSLDALAGFFIVDGEYQVWMDFKAK